MTRLYRLFLLVIPVLFAAGEAMACSACQGNPDSEMTKGAQAGVLMMVGVTYVLLLGVGACVASWIVRARRMGQPL
ncbi:MAG: hypothetical protein IPK83_15810 [Planctomycetes bacterium]|nr:hypothetical protein [Planctomycetota bacterium]